MTLCITPFNPTSLCPSVLVYSTTILYQLNIDLRCRTILSIYVENHRCCQTNIRIMRERPHPAYVCVPIRAPSVCGVWGPLLGTSSVTIFSPCRQWSWEAKLNYWFLLNVLSLSHKVLELLAKMLFPVSCLLSLLNSWSLWILPDTVRNHVWSKNAEELRGANIDDIVRGHFNIGSKLGLDCLTEYGWM